VSVKGLKQADWIAAAREHLSELSNEELMETTAWKIEWCFRITRWGKAEELLIAEKLKRGLISLSDLTPDQRRKAIDPANLNLRAIADAPIMDAANIYLPAGKLSTAETRERERRILRGEPI
jgi:hypothetical protein